jgi:outer membrane receptor protein involved in Fe transport
MMNSRLLTLLLVLILTAGLAYAGNTGKIAGRVTSAENGEPLVGVSVMVVGTTTGAATDVDGNFTIINISPGAYTVLASGVGFQKKQFVNVKVSADFTTRLDITLNAGEITLEAVVVQAEAPMIRKDLTSSHTVVGAAEIQALPVETVGQLLTLQAGVVQGAGGELHIRGGRSTEIAYKVNGVSIMNPFDNSRSVQIATNAIEELSVISGTFNAEYGNALSGIVNAVTKEGGSAYHGSVSFNTGDQVSSRSDVFYNIDHIDPLNHFIAEATASGPIAPGFDEVSFFASGRYDRDNGYFYGKREHTPEDFVSKDPINPNQMVVVSTGDGSIVPMNTSKDLSLTGKLAFSPTPTVKIRYDALYSNAQYRTYNHDFKYNPDARPNNYDWGLLQALELRHSIGDRTYYTVKGSYNINNSKSYLYPLLDKQGNEVNFNAGMVLDTALYMADPRYQPDYKLSPATNYTFVAGGTLNGQYYQRSSTWDGKFDITSQITQSHEVKGGADFRYHVLNYESFTILRDTIRYRTPTIPAVSTPDHDRYTRFPIEFSAYIQDKMEFNSFILNVGLRYDYFEPRAKYAPSTSYPSPYSPNITPNMDLATILVNAKGKSQLSPRVGVSFPITDRGIIHFSYGHFFQMPPFQYLYANPDFKYPGGTPLFGNANLNPEKTVTYELGLQQQLFENLSFTLTGYYKDVRDLLALQQIRISGEAEYLKYVNKDYGNIMGVTFSLTKRRTASDWFGFTLDYTFQSAEGNDTNVDAFFLDLSSGRQSEKIPVYLSWDQTHTLNATITIGRPSDWNISIVGRIGSGLPYTPQITAQTVFLQTNSGRKPTYGTVDVLADKSFAFAGFNITVYMKVYNLFDALNERLVYTDTGRATYTLTATKAPAVQTDLIAAQIPGVHSADEYLARPDYYWPPREVRAGVSVEF